ncbi:aspartate ammonia-lyase (plasmid) [Pseudalkalibacillus hwajinpoensis]|uniref:aspartate ammonia-lyase n=1 Tax=Guptibacillus hwajinpoensis TaxID=208199 RepID=UPI00325B84CF
MYKVKTSRVEKDFLGEKEIPINAYYGIQTLRASENFPITGYRIHESLITSVSMVKKAAAEANISTGRLSSHLGNAIIKASTEIIHGEHHDQFIVDPIQGGAGTSINMNANEVICNRALEILGQEKGDYPYLSPNTHVNMSQSTNDTFPTTIHLAVLSQLDQLLVSMRKMKGVFMEKAEEFDHVIKVGRTHLQDAVPIRLGQEFGSYERMIGRDIERINSSFENLYEINLGATAVGTGLNADPDYVSGVVSNLRKISGYPLVSAENLVDATANTDLYTEISGHLKTCMLNMSKVANDLRLMASGPRAGMNEIDLPARQPGSSIMPGKVNPVMAEVINQIAFQVVGNDQTICLSSEAGQLQLNVMEPVLIFNLLESIKVMKNGFGVFTDYCVKGIKANESVMKNNVENSIGVVTALNPYIGYEKASEIARKALYTGQTIRNVCLKEGVLTDTELNRILDTHKMTSPGVLSVH